MYKRQQLSRGPGLEGPQGPPGPVEVSLQQLNLAIADTPHNPTSVHSLVLDVGDPPTQQDIFSVVRKLNELIAALQRQP